MDALEKGFACHATVARCRETNGWLVSSSRGWDCEERLFSSAGQPLRSLSCGCIPTTDAAFYSVCPATQLVTDLCSEAARTSKGARAIDVRPSCSPGVRHLHDGELLQFGAELFGSALIVELPSEAPYRPQLGTRAPEGVEVTLLSEPGALRVRVRAEHEREERLCQLELRLHFGAGNDGHLDERP